MSATGGESATVGPHMSLNVSIRSSTSNTNINEIGRDSNGGYASPTAERPIEHGTKYYTPFLPLPPLPPLSFFSSFFFFFYYSAVCTA